MIIHEMNIVNEIHYENRGRINPDFIILTIHPTLKFFWQSFTLPRYIPLFEPNKGEFTKPPFK